MRILLVGLAVLPLQGCDALGRLLSVEPQDRAPASAIESSPANAKLLANSAVADFDCAFGAYVVIGGLIGFGVMGLFVGPVLLAATYTLAKSWVAEGPQPGTSPGDSA